MNNKDMPDYPVMNHKVTVCSSCLCACCWQGSFMCDEARYAGTLDKTVADLNGSMRENPEWWFKDPSTGVVDSVLFAQFTNATCVECYGTGFCDGPGDAHPSTKTTCIACDAAEAALAELEKRS
jgi:hypothetical protein